MGANALDMHPFRVYSRSGRSRFSVESQPTRGRQVLGQCLRTVQLANEPHEPACELARRASCLRDGSSALIEGRRACAQHPKMRETASRLFYRCCPDLGESTW